MRRHASAVTAASNRSWVEHLGRIFRGALATRVSSRRSDGTGAPSVRFLRTALLLGALTVLAILALAPLASAAPKLVVGSIGREKTGTEGSKFNAPRGVAVNESGAGGVAQGTFYVVDSSNNRIQQFGPSGAFVKTWGWGVRDGEGEFETCSVAAKCRQGQGGPGAGELSAPQGIASPREEGV